MNIMKKDEKKGVYLTQVSNRPDICFLTFHRPVTIYSQDIVDWQAGAYIHFVHNKWVTVDDTFVKENKTKFTHTLLWDFSLGTAPSLGYLDLFSETIRTYLDGFTHEHRHDYLKGRTFGSAVENCPGLVMKALKTGFDALGIVKSAYGGWRTSAFTVNDISAYMKRMITYGAKLLNGNLYRGVEGVGPAKGSIPKDPGQYLRSWRLKADRGIDSQKEQLYGSHIQDTVLTKYKPTPEKVGSFFGGNDQNFRSPLINPERGYVVVSEYGFRGDARPPVDIKALGGMNPNAIRDDREAQRGNLEVLDNFNHQADWGSAYSGYVSWSRNIGAAFKFVRMVMNEEGWIYAARCRDAVDVAATFSKPRYQEYEISVPGGTEWFDIVAWRRVFKKQAGGHSRYFWDSKIYVTTNQQILPKTKRAELLKLFSWPLNDIAKG